MTQPQPAPLPQKGAPPSIQGPKLGNNDKTDPGPGELGQKPPSSAAPAELGSNPPVPEPPKIATEFTSYAVLPMRGTGGMFVLRKVKIKDGEIVSIETSVDDMQAIQIGKAIIAFEELTP